MPAGQGNDPETVAAGIFADAVERSGPPGPGDDPGLADALDVVALLRTHGAQLGPRPDERARARAAVLARLAAPQDPSDRAYVPPPEPVATVRSGGAATAVLPAVDVDAADPPDDGPDDPVDELAVARSARRAGRHTLPAGGRAARRRTGHRPQIAGRIVFVAAASVVAAAVLGGGGVLASRDALPGDNLYGVKRAAESAGLAMTFDDTERAHRHLDLASTRIDELEQLVADDPQRAADPQVYGAALRDFDSDADEGSRLLLNSPDVPREQAEAELQSWASGQAERLATLRPTLPGPAASQANGSLDRLEELAGPGTVPPPSPCAQLPTGPAAQACADAVGPTTPDTAAPGTVSPSGPGGSTGPATTGPATTGRAPGTSAGPSTRSSDEGGAREQGDRGLLPQVTDGLGDVLGGGERSGSTDDGTDDPSDDSGSGGSGGGLPPIEVPPLLPGIGGVSLGG